MDHVGETCVKRAHHEKIKLLYCTLLVLLGPYSKIRSFKDLRIIPMMEGIFFKAQTVLDHIIGPRSYTVSCPLTLRSCWWASYLSRFIGHSTLCITNSLAVENSFPNCVC